MTANQIAYWANQETRRANLAREAEATRHNVATEQESIRSAKAKEAENYRSATAKEAETYRHNVTTEQETKRKNTNDIVQGYITSGSKLIDVIWSNALDTVGTKAKAAGQLVKGLFGKEGSDTKTSK